MLELSGIARSTYYYYLKQKDKDKDKYESEKQDILEIYNANKGRYGYRRICAVLKAKGCKINHKTVLKLMKSLGLRGKQSKNGKYHSYKGEVGKVADNLLKRDFHADKPNEKWTTDVTEFKIPEVNKKLYLSAILDLYDRTPVSYVLSARNDNALVFKTFDLAIAANPDATPLFHSDRGFQYTSKVFKMKLQEQGMEQSMSRVGHCIDNGPTEGFWGIIKTEMYCMYDITDEKTLREAIESYMNFYTNERPQERFDGKTPAQVRKEAMLTDAPKDYPISENKRIQKYKAKWAA